MATVKPAVTFGKIVADAKIVSPLTSFNELSVAQLTPTSQGDFIYGINDVVFREAYFAGASTAASGGFGIVQSGTSASGSANIRLRRNLKYRPGMGSLFRGTAVFDTPVDLNAQLIGLGNAESGYYFGYLGTNFGIVHQESGQIEIRRLTVTTAVTTNETVTITLDGVSVSVPVTGGANINQTSYSIGQYDFSQVGSGWRADVIDGTVFFVAARVGPYTGSYTATGASFVGTFVGIQTGSNSVSTFIPQSSWNEDTCDGCGPSGFNLNKQKGNVYQVGFQYLGFGNAFFSIEDSETGRIIPVHIIKNANARTTPVLKNPQVAGILTSTNYGSTTSVKPKSASMAIFNEGMVKKLDPRYAASNTFTYNSTTDAPVIALKVNRVSNAITCFGEMDILRIAASNESTNKTLTVSVYKNLDIRGDVNFQYIDSRNSIVSRANLVPGTNTVTTTGKIPFLTFVVGSNQGETIDITSEELVFGAGEIVVFCIHTSGAVTGEIGINWFEQQ